MNVHEKQLHELAGQDPIENPSLFGQVRATFDQLEATAPGRLAEAVAEFEKESAHWPEWTWSMQQYMGAHDVRVIGSGYRSWAGEVYSGRRSAKYGIARAIAMPAENWSKPFSLFNLNEAADDLPRLNGMYVDKGSLSAKYLKTWREEGFWQRLRYLDLRVKFGAATARELRKSRLDGLEKLTLQDPQGDALKELGKARNLDSLVALDVVGIQDAMDASEWGKVSWIRGLRALRLSGATTDAQMEAFVDACGLATLEELELRIQGEAGWLSRLSRLRAIRLSGNVDREAFCAVLEHNPGVEWLEMLNLPEDGGLEVLAEHGTKLKYLDLRGAHTSSSRLDALPDMRPVWHAMLEAGVLSEAREIHISHDFDVECAAMLEEHAPKLERLGWYWRDDTFFDYVQADPWLSARAKGR